MLRMLRMSSQDNPLHLTGSGDVEKVSLVFEPLLDQEVFPEKVAAVRVEESKRKPVIGEDHTIVETVKTLDFWNLFVSFLCGEGTGLVVMNNMGQMGLVLRYANVSIFVSLTSIFRFFSRIGSGTISEYFLEQASQLKIVENRDDDDDGPPSKKVLRACNSEGKNSPCVARDLKLVLYPTTTRRRSFSFHLLLLAPPSSNPSSTNPPSDSIENPYLHAFFFFHLLLQILMKRDKKQQQQQ